MGIHVIPKKDATGNVEQLSSPFASKAVTGGKLFRRKHGFVSASVLAGQTTTITLVVPYNIAKINEIELLNCDLGDTANFKVYDDPSGTISGYPNILLNQFAFDCQLPDGFYRDRSDYDADVILNMKIEIEYTNNGTLAKSIRGNIVYHQVV